jgi:small subunit ribosomal protein S14
MATKGKIARNEHRKAVVARYAQRRAELKAIVARPSSTGAERAEAQRELRAQPRDASPVRVRNRDSVDGRPRGFLRAFGVSRVRVRGLAHEGYLPGVRKSSW